MAEPVTDEKPAALPPELAQLQAEAAAIEAEAAPAAAEGEQGAPAEAVDYDADAKGLVDIAADSLGAFYPSTEKVLAADKRIKIAAALAPVLRKHGFSLADFFGRWGEEIALCFALSQVAIPLAKAIQADRAAAAKAKAEEPAPPPPPAESAATTAAPPPSGLHSRA